VKTPYDDLPPEAFWRSGVVEEKGRLWEAKFPITPALKLATAGSCFAQHLSRALVSRGFDWLDSEPAPAAMTPQACAAFNYGVFSFRTGNIYTPALLAQWMKWAIKGGAPLEVAPDKDGFRDLMRPNIEPTPFNSEGEARASLDCTLDAIHRGLRLLDVFVFTLGLTEAWRNKQTGVIYPMCPGTVAGTFDPDLHEFVNFSYVQTKASMREAIRYLRAANPNARVLLTVSPVPLTATASGKHVLPSTIYSKSTLRAVAGDIAGELPYVDYFPSYEIISAFPSRGTHYEDNLRSVRQSGVDTVMGHFFAGLGEGARAPARPAAKGPAPKVAKGRAPADADAVICEDELLDLRRHG
jgi:hypothetical protein